MATNKVTIDEKDSRDYKNIPMDQVVQGALYEDTSGHVWLGLVNSAVALDDGSSLFKSATCLYGVTCMYGARRLPAGTKVTIEATAE